MSWVGGDTNQGGARAAGVNGDIPFEMHPGKG